MEVCLMCFMSVAFLSLLERKVLGLIQNRKGPNKVYLWGVFQPFSDALKLLTKLSSSPTLSFNEILYYLSPLGFITLSFMPWVVLPFWGGFNEPKFSGLMFIFLMSLSIYALIFSGWFSNSKYSLLGSVRSISQTISYEIVFTFSLLLIFIMSSSSMFWVINKYQNVMWFMFPMAFIMFSLFLSALAEMGRTPFDLSEGESELVSGYSVEYGGIQYTLIFLSENLSILLNSLVMNLLFMGGFSPMKTMFVVFVIIWIRGSIPRIRFDKIIYLCWIIILPSVISSVSIISIISLQKSVNTLNFDLENGD